MPIRERLNAKSPEDSVAYLNMLIYGEPGAGKTFLLGTAEDYEDTSPMLLIDIEGGTLTLRRRNVDVVQVRSMKQLEEIHKELVNDTEGYYKTVGIDSLTELQKLDMRTVMQEQFNKRPDSTDLYVPSQREWGKSGERVRMVVRAFRDLEINTLVTALMSSDKDEKTGLVSYFPSFPGKLRSEIPGFFDVVGLLTTYNEGDVVHRKLQFAKTQRVVAKDRTDSLGEMMVNPSIPLMWEKIHRQEDEVKEVVAV